MTQPRTRSIGLNAPDPILSDAEVSALLKLADIAPVGKTVVLHRAARVVALVVGIAAEIQRRFEGGRAPWEVEVPLDAGDLSVRTGLPAAQVEEAVRALRESGAWDEMARGGARRVRFVAEVFSAGAEHLAWPEILDVLAGDAAALMVCRALADRLSPGLGEWKTLARGDLATRSVYGIDTVRRAISVLVRDGILLERRADGRESRYAFSDFARGLAGRYMPHIPIGAPLGSPSDTDTAAPPVEFASGAPEAIPPGRDSRVAEHGRGQGSTPIVEGAPTIVVGGVNITVEAGMQVRIMRDAAGGVRVAIDP